MRNKDGTGGEAPIVRFWYGKGAKYKSIEELIDKNPSWFIWAVENFQDVTPSQAEHFRKKWGMELPEDVIGDVPPYEHTKDSTEDEYMKLCEEYARNKKRTI